MNLLNSLILFLFLSFIHFGYGVGHTEKKQIQIDQIKIQEKVLEWADNNYYFHDGYRYEDFHAHYSEEYYVLMLRADQYLSKMESLKDQKKNKSFIGSEIQYQEKIVELTRKYDKMKYLAQNYPTKADYYEILFWSNIKTKDGYPVYYSHKFKLSNDLIVMSVTKKSEIGNKSTLNKIIFNQG